MAKRKKRALIPKLLILTCLISGLGTLVINMVNGRMQVSELGEIAELTGTAFAISLLIIIGIWLVNMINKK